VRASAPIYFDFWKLGSGMCPAVAYSGAPSMSRSGIYESISSLEINLGLIAAKNGTQFLAEPRRASRPRRIVLPPIEASSRNNSVNEKYF
jgi:hypothetical protein